mgnify:CR=1 FL=1
MDLPAKGIVFQSELTPSAIVNLTKGQIVETAKSAEAVSVDLYDDTMYEPPIYPDQRRQ